MSACRSCGATLPERARFCPSCGVSTEAGEATRERKVATMLFVDLVSSTELGEGDPEQTRAVLKSFYEAMSSEVVRAGGVVEKFAGDAVMAAFGAPASLEDHPERALHAALGMRRRLAELFDGRLELRIGELPDTPHGWHRGWFAFRALGRVRGDRALIAEALADFEAYRLDSFAEETRGLL